MRRLLSSYLIILFPFILNAQGNLSDSLILKNTLYVELLGPGTPISFNYDYLLNTDKKIKNSFSLGITMLPYYGGFFLGTSASYNFIFGNKKSHFESGFGIGVLEYKNPYRGSLDEYEIENSVHFHARMGYRFQNPEGGFFFRFSFTPLVSIWYQYFRKINGGFAMHQKVEYFSNVIGTGAMVIPYGGICLGYTLKK